MSNNKQQQQQSNSSFSNLNYHNVPASSRMHQSLSAIPSYARPEDWVGDRSLNTSNHGREEVKQAKKERLASESLRPDFFLGGSEPQTPTGPRRKIISNWIAGGGEEGDANANANANKPAYIEHKPSPKTAVKEYKWKKRLSTKLEAVAKAEQAEQGHQQEEEELQQEQEQEQTIESESTTAPTATNNKTVQKKKSKKRTEGLGLDQDEQDPDEASEEEDPLPTPKPGTKQSFGTNNSPRLTPKATPKMAAPSSTSTSTSSYYENVVYGSLTGKMILSHHHLVYDPYNADKGAKKVAWTKIQKHQVSPKATGKHILKVILATTNKSLTFYFQTRAELVQVKDEISSILKKDKHNDDNNKAPFVVMDKVKEEQPTDDKNNEEDKNNDKRRSSKTNDDSHLQDNDNDSPNDQEEMEDESIRLPYETTTTPSTTTTPRATTTTTNTTSKAEGDSASILDFSVMNMSSSRQQKDKDHDHDNEKIDYEDAMTAAPEREGMAVVQEEPEPDKDDKIATKDSGNAQEGDATAATEEEVLSDSTPVVVEQDGGNNFGETAALEAVVSVDGNQPGAAAVSASTSADVDKAQSQKPQVKVTKANKMTKKKTPPRAKSAPLQKRDDPTATATTTTATTAAAAPIINLSGTTSCKEHEKIIQDQAQEIANLKAQLAQANNNCEKLVDKLDMLRMVLYQDLKQEGMRNIWT